MAKKFTESHEVLYYNCDTTGRMTVPMLLNIIIKTSETQSDLLQRGADFVASFGLTWVITEYSLSIERLPKVGEKIKVITQATSYNKFFCYRNFWIHDALGNECVAIQATFVLMDLKNRKMSRVLPEIVDAYDCEKITKIIRGEKISPVEKKQFQSYRVRYLDIDSNKHVNNSRYLEWMLDVLGFDFLISHKIQSIHIKFEKEVEYGNEIASYWETKEDGNQILSSHQIKIGDQIYSEANLVWKK